MTRRRIIREYANALDGSGHSVSVPTGRLTDIGTGSTACPRGHRNTVTTAVVGLTRVVCTDCGTTVGGED